MRNYIAFRYWLAQAVLEPDGIPVTDLIEFVGEDDDECEKFALAYLAYRSKFLPAGESYSLGSVEKNDRWLVLNERYLLNMMKFNTWYGNQRNIQGWTDPTVMGFGPRIKDMPLIPWVRMKSPRDSWSHGH